MDKVQVPVEMFQKMVGFIETTKGAFDKQAADTEALKAAAGETVKKLVDGEYLPAEKSAALIENLVADPTNALDLIVKFAEDMTEDRKKIATLEKAASEQPSKDEDEVLSMGAGDTQESSTSFGKKASDAAWESGFQV